MGDNFPRLPPPPWEEAGLPALSAVLSYILFWPFAMMRSLSLPGLPAPGGGASYTNEESWEIQRGKDGRIAGVVIHRRAEED